MYSQHNVYSHNIILLFEDKFQMYEQCHVYQSKFLKDKSNDYLINHLKKGKNQNILFEFLLSKFEDEKEHNYDLNIKECGLYKKLYERRR